MIERLQKILDSVTGELDLDISPETNIATDMGLSSFGIIRLVCAIEDEFDIDIPNSDLKNFKKVEDVIKYLENLEKQNQEQENI